MLNICAEKWLGLSVVALKEFTIPPTTLHAKDYLDRWEMTEKMCVIPVFFPPLRRVVTFLSEMLQVIREI